jgi:regulator of sigma E protease
MTVFVVIVILIAILAFLILAHEFGHFVAARLLGIRVDEFGIGFPPRAFLLGKIGDTEYTVNWIFFGGFVRLYGEEEDKGIHGTGSLLDSPRWKQAVILLAGVAMNVVVAYALFAFALGIGVPAIVDQLQPDQAAQLLVSDVIPGSPADQAGIAADDQILSVEDAQGDTVPVLTPAALVAFVSDHGGQPLTITFMAGQTTITKTVIPANSVDPQNAGRPAIGIGVVLVATVALAPLQAMQQAFWTTEGAFVLVGQGVGEIFSTAAHGSPDLSNVVGPVGLYWVVGSTVQSGFGNLLELVAFISVNLAIVNMIPIPALDGGRFVVLLIEALLRKRAPRLAIQLLDTIGVALIILLAVTVTYHDLAIHFM